MKQDVVIIGGGAAGLMCAVTLKQAAEQANLKIGVTVLEKSGKILRKLLATGNGRCNYTNLNAGELDESGKKPIHYFGGEPSFATKALRGFNPLKTIDFFKGLGIMPYFADSGKVFPMSLQAASVVDMLRLKAEQLGVAVRTDFDVVKVKRNGNNFVINAIDGGQEQAAVCVIGVGSCASVDGFNGYSLLEALGHSTTKLSPALVQLKTEKHFTHSLKGIKVDATVSAIHNNKVIGAETGELLFTDYGLSGPVIFSISKYYHFYDKLTLQIDFFPEYSEDSLIQLITERKNNLPYLTTEDFLSGIINKRVGQAIVKASGIEKLAYPVSGLSNSQTERLARLFKKTTVSVVGTTGFKNAQITAGGTKTDAFDPETMRSKLVKNLYAVGETLDISGDCGGYNLQWAWSSGYLAAIDIVRRWRMF